MNNKILSGLVVGALILAGASFFAGMEYSKTSVATGQPTQRQGGLARNGVRNNNTGFTMGKVIAKDGTSITVELGNNASSTNSASAGSKIVLYTGSTQIGKFTTGSASDIAIGQSVTISGTPNSDGSLTAQMIQIRPSGAGVNGFGQR